MAAKVLVTIADEREFAPWRRLRDFRKVAGESEPLYRAELGGSEVLVALTGIGAERAGRVAGHLATQYSPIAGIVAGTAGGLRPQFSPGDVLVAESVSEAEGMETFRCDPALLQLAVECGAEPVRRFLTFPRIVGKSEEKLSLIAEGDAAEMESMGVMKELFRRGIPAVAVRVITDPVEMDMPFDFAAALDSRGRVRLARILTQLARRPHRLPGLVRFAFLTQRATTALARFLDRFVEGLAARQEFSTPTAAKVE